MANVTFDYTNLVEVEGGINDGELRDMRPRLEEAMNTFLEDQPGFMRLPETTELSNPSKTLAEEVRDSGATDFIHVGIGGSALGPIALHRALNHPYYNLLTDRGGPRLHFAENTDPATLSAILDVVDKTNTWVNVVTKSGSTAETMANFLVIRGAIVEALGEDAYGERVVFTTDPEEGYLVQIAEREGIKTLQIPPDVGGRFSVLTPVGLFPAAVTGLDVDAFCVAPPSAPARWRREVRTTLPYRVPPTTISWTRYTGATCG
jgi:glucose-6-phosphate isomerase